MEIEFLKRAAAYFDKERAPRPPRRLDVESPDRRMWGLLFEDTGETAHGAGSAAMAIGSSPVTTEAPHSYCNLPLPVDYEAGYRHDQQLINPARQTEGKLTVESSH